MRFLLIIFAFLPAAVVASAQAPELTADRLVHSNPTIHGTGHVRAKVGGIAIQADEGTWHSDTGVLELSGHVHATLPAREDRYLFRNSASDILTDQPVELSADRLTLDRITLQAAGNLLILTNDPDKGTSPQIKGDEMSLTLKNGDATVRGNVRTNLLVSQPSQFGRLPIRPFPLDFEIHQQ